MKKLLTITATLGLAAAAFGQGSVNFTATGSTISMNRVLGGALTGKTSTTGYPVPAFYYEMFIAPNGTLPAGTAEGANAAGGFQAVDPTTLGFVDSGYTATNTSVVGRLALVASQGDASGYADMTAVSSSAYAAGDTADLMIVGWSANLGTSWQTVKAEIDANSYSGTGLNGWVGESLVEPVELGGGSTPTPQVPSSASIPGFGLFEVPIPEPATFALCGLGAAALVIFRRRN